LFSLILYLKIHRMVMVEIQDCSKSFNGISFDQDGIE